MRNSREGAVFSRTGPRTENGFRQVAFPYPTQVLSSQQPMPPTTRPSTHHLTSSTSTGIHFFHLLTSTARVVKFNTFTTYLRLEEQLYLERCGMLRSPVYPPISAPFAHPVYPLRYPPPPDLMATSMALMSPVMHERWQIDILQLCLC